MMKSIILSLFYAGSVFAQTPLPVYVPGTERSEDILTWGNIIPPNSRIDSRNLSSLAIYPPSNSNSSRIAWPSNIPSGSGFYYPPANPPYISGITDQYTWSTYGSAIADGRAKRPEREGRPARPGRPEIPEMLKDKYGYITVSCKPNNRNYIIVFPSEIRRIFEKDATLYPLPPNNFQFFVPINPIVPNSTIPLMPPITLPAYTPSTPSPIFTDYPFQQTQPPTLQPGVFGPNGIYPGGIIEIQRNNDFITLTRKCKYTKRGSPCSEGFIIEDQFVVGLNPCTTNPLNLNPIFETRDPLQLIDPIFFNQGKGVPLTSLPISGPVSYISSGLVNPSPYVDPLTLNLNGLIDGFIQRDKDVMISNFIAANPCIVVTGGELILCETNWYLPNGELYTPKTLTQIDSEFSVAYEQNYDMMNAFMSQFRCFADVTEDGSVDGDDFSTFMNSFAIGNALVDDRADVNNDTVIDSSDFILFTNSFANSNGGC